MEFKKVVENVYVLKAPFSVVWTGVVLIVGKHNFLIDSGADTPETYIIPALKKLGLEITDIDYLLNTHCHGDHISGHYDLVHKYGLQTVAIDEAVYPLAHPDENAIRIRTKYPKFSPEPQSWLKGVRANIVLRDGEVLENRLKVIHTPGHDMDCVCWYDILTKTIITGDSIQANGTPTQGIGFYQNLPMYLDSLLKLQQEDIENIVCGHEYDGIGGIILGKENVKQSLQYCLELVQVYETEIKSCLDNGINKPDEIAIELINKIGCGMPEQLFLALYTVNEHLRNLKEKRKL